MNKIFGFGLVVLGVALMRLIPHPPNFTPMLAIALFAGAKAPQRWLGFVLPIAALILSDAILGMHDLMWVVAGCLFVTTWMGALAEPALAGQKKSGKVFGWLATGLAASIFFFLATNFAVWASSGMYPHTSEGLWTCFVMALPFFHNQVISTWAVTGALFGIWAALAPALERERVPNR